MLLLSLLPLPPSGCRQGILHAEKKSEYEQAGWLLAYAAFLALTLTLWFKLLEVQKLQPIFYKAYLSVLNFMEAEHIKKQIREVREGRQGEKARTHIYKWSESAIGY